ncbi:MAG: DUF177 domain-containing protein [Dehalococcoidia bacterium]|nr:DUF177 domain-containing protein [Dehalococcoidia bacterium]MYI85685.1 DUF177 domain-containing protein [Dehalococcoidia bacterium]
MLWGGAILTTAAGTGLQEGRVELPPLTFNVSQLLADGSGASRVHELTPSGSLAGGRVELVRIGAGALVRASLEITLEAECSRCLSPLALPTAIAFDEVYEQRYDVGSGARLDDGDMDPEAFTISQSHLIDITEGVRQYCEAAAPMQPLCSADCEGFCPSCGIDRNTGDCACEPVASDPRWAALAELRESKH